MYLDAKPGVDNFRGSQEFSKDNILPDFQDDTMWNTILYWWATIYIGLPYWTLIDQDTILGDPFECIFQISDVQLDRTGIQSNSILNLGDYYHHSLRTVFRRLMGRSYSIIKVPYLGIDGQIDV